MNTRTMVAAIAISAALAWVLGCSGSKQISPYAREVVLSGCLEPGDAPQSFRLAVNGTPNGMVGTTGAHQTDVPGSSVAESNTSDLGAPTTRIYSLVPGKNVDLAVEQGRVVQIRGHLEERRRNEQATGTSGSGGANPTTGQGPQSSVHGPAANRPVDMIRVDSVQRVGGNCGQTR